MRKLVTIRTDISGKGVSYLLYRYAAPEAFKKSIDWTSELPYEYKGVLGYFERRKVRNFLRAQGARWTMKEL